MKNLSTFVLCLVFFHWACSTVKVEPKEEPRVDPVPTFITTPAMEFRIHQVLKGETLWSIARGEYGDSTLWPGIFDMNRDWLLNPNLIEPGTKVRVPVLNESQKAFAHRDSDAEKKFEHLTLGRMP